MTITIFVLFSLRLIAEFAAYVMAVIALKVTVDCLIKYRDENR